MLPLVTIAARIMALMGGAVLSVLIALTCISVMGRGLNTLAHSDLLQGLAPALAAGLISTGIGPVTGDYELVEAGVAFAIFAFLPICQLYAGHATVDVFAAMMPGRTNVWLTAFWEVVLAIVIVVIAWRLHAGFTEKLSNGQTSFLLQFPVWWAYGASLIAAGLAGLVGLYCAAARVAEAVTGRRHLPQAEEADH